MRALLIALQAWITDDQKPPESVYPRLDERTLGSVADYLERFPAIPELRLPTDNLKPPRLDLGPRFAERGIADKQPATLGEAFGTKVPLPDEDGIDLGGIRLPQMAVPVATHTGWNLRQANTGAPTKLARWSGSMIPIPATDEARLAADDPRRSLESRYKSADEYLRRIKRAADDLVDRGFLLTRDLDHLVDIAGERYQRVQAHNPSDIACDFSQLAAE
jgi:hypothetical protein